MSLMSIALAPVEAEWAARRPACPHNQFELRVRARANGIQCRNLQCLTCGSASGTKLSPNAPPASSLPPWDEGLAARWWPSRRDKVTEWSQGRRTALHAVWWSTYNAYLQSPEWAALRAFVITRDGGRCQRCPSPGAHVHHLTYERVTEEALGDLLLLCVPCHDLEHAEPTL